MLYLRPLYVQSDATAQPSYQYILASYNDNAAFGETIQEALAKLFPGFNVDVGDVIGGDLTPDVPGTDPGSEPDDTPAADSTPERLLAEADALFEEANAALAASPPDFATYSDKINQARQKVQQALDLLAPDNG